MFDNQTTLTHTHIIICITYELLYLNKLYKYICLPCEYNHHTVINWQIPLCIHQNSKIGNLEDLGLENEILAE